MEEADSISPARPQSKSRLKFRGKEVPKNFTFRALGVFFITSSRQPLSSFIRGNLSEAFDPEHEKRDIALRRQEMKSAAVARSCEKLVDFQVQTQFPQGSSSLTFNRRLMPANATASKFLGKEKGGRGDNDDKSIPCTKEIRFKVYLHVRRRRGELSRVLYIRRDVENTSKASLEMLRISFRHLGNFK